MGKGYKHGGSGGANPLNFEVKAYPSETEMNLATAKANTVGVATTNPITGWYFTAEQPENMAEGEIWFPVGTKSNVSFNALKKNNVTVYPQSAKQMVSGELKDVVAKSYQDGEWVEWWSGQLFTNGNQWEYVTGGWTTDGYQYTHSTGYTQESAEIGDTIKVSVKPGGTANGWNCVIVGTRNLIDLTDVSVIKCRATDVNTAFLCVHNSKIYADLSAITRVNIVDGVASLDVSSISGEQYVFIHVHCGSDERKVTASEIWTE